jgi:energy-coupling factor transport system permease protein
VEDFELLRNVTIGQYLPTGSIIHRLDPRSKILAGLCLLLAVSLSSKLVPVGLLLLAIIGIALLARVPIGYLLRGLVLGLPVLAMVFTLQLIFQGRAEPAGQVYLVWGWFRITRFSLQLIAVGILRILGFIFLTSLLTMTATVTELTHGTESLLKPFRPLGVPSYELALINMIALRFVPTLAEEMERIMKAQASRCADLGGSQRFWRPDKAARAYLPLIVPLFLSGFRRAEELVLAMEARCYVGGERRTKFVVLKSSWRDFAVVFIALGFSAAVVAIHWPAVRELLALLGLRGL